MGTASAASPAPVGVGERVEELDVLRGVALFGVFLMNMLFLNHVVAVERQLLSLPTGPLDYTLDEIAAWLVADKANTPSSGCGGRTRMGVCTG